MLSPVIAVKVMNIIDFAITGDHNAVIAKFRNKVAIDGDRIAHHRHIIAIDGDGIACHRRL
jgi:hypothetical protein